MIDETPETNDLGKESKPSVPTPSGIQKPDIRNDIARILQNVQLPERRGGLAETPVRKVEPKIIPTTPTLGEAPPTPVQEGALTAVHTFKDDLTRVARDQKISVVKAISLEEEKRHREKPKDFDETVQKHSARPFIIGSVLLTFLGIMALVAVALISARQQPIEAIPTTSLMFTEQAVSLTLNQETGMDLKRILYNARDKASTLGSFTQIVPMMPNELPLKATSQEFLDKLSTRAPSSLARALGPEFFIGIHVVDINAPFIVFTVDSYENAFAGMLAWEETLGQDLQPFFTGAPALSTVSGAPARRMFGDEIIRNYDIRSLKNDEGKVVLYYAFPSRKILVIAESPFSFTEIVTRLKAQRTL